MECRSQLTITSVRQPSIRAYMDDLKVTKSSVPGCRRILQGLERLIKWAKMSVKPAKSRSLVLKRGKVSDKLYFSLDGTEIPSINEKTFWLQLQRCSSHPDIHQGSWHLAEQSGQVWIAWKIQVLGIPSQHPASDPLAIAGLWGVHHNGNSGEQNQRLHIETWLM